MQPVLEFNGITKSFGNFPAINGVSFCVYGGVTLGVTGAAGSGKSVLCSLAAGLLRPDKGEIFVCGQKHSTKTKAQISYLLDADAFYGGFSAAQTVKLYADFFKDFDSGKAYLLLGELGIDINKKYADLPLSARQLISAALAFCRNARLYILDAPLSALSPRDKTELLRKLLSERAEDSAVLLAEKDVFELNELCCDMLLLQNSTTLFYGSAEDFSQRFPYGFSEHYGGV
ncbi:MAG: ATP-binding cassette domain-containing protein [Oscillospiraceae bacterium]